MPKIKVFSELVKYHIKTNLRNWLLNAQIVDDKIEPKHGIVLEEGLDENPYTKGFLVFKDGPHLAERMIKDRIIIDSKLPPWQKIRRDGDFVKYIKGELGDNRFRSRESAYVVNAESFEITRIREANNNILRRTVFKHYLPQDFLSENSGIDVDEGIGLKTRNAIRLPIRYKKVRSYQIKSTPYSNTGIGVVAEYTKDGLSRTVHFERISDSEDGFKRRARLGLKPNEDIPYVDVDFKIAMVYREYSKEGRKVKCSFEKVLDISQPESSWFVKTGETVKDDEREPYIGPERRDSRSSPEIKTKTINNAQASTQPSDIRGQDTSSV